MSSFRYRQKLAQKRVVPWLPPPLPLGSSDQFDLFIWQDVYDREFRKALYRDLDHPYDERRFDVELKSLPQRVVGILMQRQWRKKREQVYLRDGGRCMVCGYSLAGEDAAYYECGHIIDRFLGGSDHINNLVAMCIACNRLKPGTRTRAEYLAWASSFDLGCEMTEFAEKFWLEQGTQDSGVVRAA
jgi:hypothetical protein